MKKLLILVLCGLTIQQMREIKLIGNLNDGLLRAVWKDIEKNHMGENGKPLPIPYSICDGDVNCKQAVQKIGTKYYSHLGDGMYPRMKDLRPIVKEQ